MIFPFKASENTAVDDTIGQRFREFLCRTFGCIRYGSYYGMPQATCRRCGTKLSGAADFVEDWRKPDPFWE